MLERIVERSVAWAIDHAKLVIALSLALTVAAAVYTARTLTMDTDTARMINAELPWKQQMADINAAFPQNVGLLVVMVDGENPDTAENAAAALFAKMQERTDLFATVRRADGGPFFDQYGMMLLPTKDLQQTSNSVIRAQGFLGSLAADPSLRGLFDMLSLAMEGVAQKAVDFASLEQRLSLISVSVSSALTGSEVPLCWRCLMVDRPVDPRELRKLILAQPNRDFQALQPGAKATAAVREMVSELALTPDHGVTVRLTGQVPLNDEEFGTVAEGMGWALFLSIVLVLGLLFAALRSVKLIIACFATLIVGLIWTFGFTALAIGSLNLVSIAFAVMFIGLSIDFGIQFGVRYGQERFIADDEHRAAPNRPLHGAAPHVGRHRHRRRVPLLPADRLQGRVRAGIDRRRRHGNHIAAEPHSAASLAEAVPARQPAARYGLPVGRADRRVPAAPALADDRHLGRGRHRRHLCRTRPALRLQSAAPEGPQGRSRSQA